MQGKESTIVGTYGSTDSFLSFQPHLLLSSFFGHCPHSAAMMYLPKLSMVAGLVAVAAGQIVTQTVCNGENYTYQELAGFALIPGNARDQFGDTIGGIGSAIALDRTKWSKLPNGSYTGVLWALPDRG